MLLKQDTHNKLNYYRQHPTSPVYGLFILNKIKDDEQKSASSKVQCFKS